MRKAFLPVILLFIAYNGWKCTEDVVEPQGPTPYEFPDIMLFRDMPDQSSNPVTKEGASLGKKLFFDPILSSDSTISCGTCHEPALSFASPFAVTPGVNAALGTRNAMTLVNLAWYASMNWDGKETHVREQNIHPVPSDVEMNLEWPDAVDRLQTHNSYPHLFEEAFPGEEIDRDLITKALEQFQLTLISYNSPFDKYMRGEGTVSTSVLRGFEVFRTERGDCFHCHSETNSPELFVTTRTIFTNNGMDTVETELDFEDNGHGDITGDPEDNGKFKIPTLRNLAYTAPFMHDGRFATLDEVIEMYDRGPAISPSLDEVMLGDAQKRYDDFGHWGLNLTPQEKADLKNFLLSLSDESFINNPEFQAPE